MVVAVVENFKQESMYGLSAGTKKVAVAEKWPLEEVQLYLSSRRTSGHHYLFMTVEAANSNARALQ